jgi:hypothetical protein
MAVFEKGCRGAEYEINVTFNVAVFKILSAPVQENRILPSKKPTVTEHGTITIDANSKRLTNWSSAVCKGDVLGNEIIRVDHSGGCAKSANRFSILPNDVRMKIICKYRTFRVFTDEPVESLFVLDIDQFFVGAGFYANDDRILRRPSRHGHDRFLDCFELSTAVLCNNNFRRRLNTSTTN